MVHQSLVLAKFKNWHPTTKTLPWLKLTVQKCPGSQKEKFVSNHQFSCAMWVSGSVRANQQPVNIDLEVRKSGTSNIDVKTSNLRRMDCHLHELCRSINPIHGTFVYLKTHGRMNKKFRELCRHGWRNVLRKLRVSYPHEILLVNVSWTLWSASM